MRTELPFRAALDNTCVLSIVYVDVPAVLKVKPWGALRTKKKIVSLRFGIAFPSYYSENCSI